MAVKARYAHTNIVARDWKKLAAFYTEVFGCEQAGPTRDHHGPWVTDLTNVAEARVKGAHLRMPGYEDGNAPTLEIFEYNHAVEPATGTSPKINQIGLAHLAFEVDDVEAARQVVLDAGGSDYGKLLVQEVPGAGTITLIYMADPEGNIFELQHWS